jgi:hypothetical protein
MDYFNPKRRIATLLHIDKQWLPRPYDGGFQHIELPRA